MNKDQLTLKMKREWCKGCGICIAFCPTKVLILDTDYKTTIAHPDKCIKCGQCELRCPDYAIYLEENKDEQ